MKIAIDPWTLGKRLRFQGTYVYAQNLLSEFKKIAAQRSDVEFGLFTSPDDSNDSRLLGAGERFELIETPQLTSERSWRLGGVVRAAARARADLLFAPTTSLLPFGKVPVITTMHDVTPIVMPSHSRKTTLLSRALLWSAARFSRALITDSEHSKQDIVKIYGLPESKVSVVYLAYDRAIFNDSAPDPETRNALLQKLGIDRPYILHHGTIQPRKNLVRLIRAYDLLLQRRPSLDLQLVLVGSLGWQFEEIVKVTKETRRGKVILTGPMNDPDLATLLKSASLVVIPSLCEGFCLPMLEAMACGAPTIVSNSSCLPEVSGNALVYFDPLSIEEIAAQMESALGNDELRSQLRTRGLARAKEFSWQKCAQKTLEVLTGAL